MTNEHGKQERVGEIQLTNCQSRDVAWAIHEIQATQELNQRARGDKTYHLLISFPSGEKPSAEVLSDIESRVCASIGFSEHQRISVVHYDTDNFHIHVGINKIHPTRHTLHEPYLAYKKLGDIATLLEVEHGLQRINHIPNKVGSENRADDMEHHSGIGSLLNWIKSECMEQLKAANSWSQFHEVLATHGLTLRERGNGFVLVDGLGFAVKASSVARELSKAKLEQSLGLFKQHNPNNEAPLPYQEQSTEISKVARNPAPYSKNRQHSLEQQLEAMSPKPDARYALKPVHMKINTTTLYARYQEEQNKAKAHCTSALARAKTRKNQLIESAKRRARLKRSAIKLLRESGSTKKALYALSSRTLTSTIEHIRSNYTKERESIYHKYQRSTWADWLKLRALDNDTEALHALRSREVRQQLKGNTLTGDTRQSDEPNLKLQTDNITKTGTIIYRIGDSAIRDDGELINMSRGASTKGIVTALHMALNRYGESLTVNGSDEFKDQVVRIAAQLRLNLHFDNPQLELQRTQLIQNLDKETNHESRGHTQFNRRGANRGVNENTRSTHSERFRIPGGTTSIRRPTKPHVARVGTQPPPESKNRLRSVSELRMVQLTDRSQMLLPGHVPSHLEQPRTQSDDKLRRDVHWPRTINNRCDGVDQYIAERELKRQKIVDIPLHRRYRASDKGSVLFSGIRQVNGQFMALFKRNAEIVVLPIDSKTALKMKKLSIGAPVHLTGRGTVTMKQRSR